MLVIALGIYALSVLVCYLVARRRALDSRYWLLAGLLIGPFAVPFVFFARPADR